MKKKLVYVTTILCMLLAAGFTEVSQIIKTYGSVSPSVGNRYIYSLNSYSNLYCRYYNTKTDQLWDSNASAMGSAATVTWSNSAVSMTDHQSTRGGNLIAVPSGLSDGWYDVTIYDGPAPAGTDTILLGKYCYIKGGIIQSMDSL